MLAGMRYSKKKNPTKYFGTARKLFFRQLKKDPKLLAEYVRVHDKRPKCTGMKEAKPTAHAELLNRKGPIVLIPDSKLLERGMNNG